MGLVRVFTHAFDSVMFAVVGAVVRHPHLTMGVSLTGLAIGVGVSALGVVGGRRAAAKAGAR